MSHSSRWWLARAGIVLAGLLVVSALVCSAAYVLFYAPPPATLPCRQCDGDARSVRVDGFDLYYRALGQRGVTAPVVLLHGGPANSSQTFKGAFDFLAAQYEVIYYDQRGSGNSQIKPAPGEYTIDQLVQELDTLRRDVIKADKIVVVGHSAGGALAQRYALAHGDHVEKLVLIGSVLPNGGMESSGLLLDAGYALINVFGGNLPPRDPLEADARFARLSYTTSQSRLYDPSRPELLQDFGYMSFAVNRDLTRSTFGGNFDAALRQVPVKTLIICGLADRSSFTGEPVAQHLHAVLPNSTLAVFEKSGHWPYLEEPEHFRQVMLDFLAE